MEASEDPLDAYMREIEQTGDTVASLRDVQWAGGHASRLAAPLHAKARNRRLELCRRLLLRGLVPNVEEDEAAHSYTAGWERHFTLEAVLARAEAARALPTPRTGISDMLFASLDRVMEAEGDATSYAEDMSDEEEEERGDQPAWQPIEGAAGDVVACGPAAGSSGDEGVEAEEKEDDPDSKALSMVVERFIDGLDPQFTPADYAAVDADEGLDTPAGAAQGRALGAGGGAAAKVAKYLWPGVSGGAPSAAAATASHRQPAPLAEAESAAQEAYFDTD